MPTVQRYGQRRVGSTALPAVRRTAFETPESRGAGVARERGRTAEAFGALAGQVGGMALDVRSKLIQQEQDRADEVALLEAENRMAAWENKRLYDPKSGAYVQRGKNALGLPEAIAQEFGEQAGAIEQGLTTDRQRDAFAKLRAQRGTNLDLGIRRHVFQQMQTWEGEELQASVANVRESAIANALDPARVQKELTRGISAIKTHGPRLGLGPEQVEKQIDDLRSAVHVGVIDRLLSNDKTRAAEVYFEEAKKQISGEQIARVEKALAEGTLRKKAQTSADKILAEGGTLTEQREKARAIEDAELRDAVMSRIEHEGNMREREKRDKEENRLRMAYNLLDRYQDVRAIPPGDWSELSGAAKSSLRSYAEALTRGVPIETDWTTYYSLMQQAMDQPEAFARRNLLEVRGRLDDAEFKQLAEKQLAMRSGQGRKADEDLNGFRTTDAILRDTLTLYGIDPGAKATSEEGKAIAQLRRMLDRRVLAHAQLNGKQPDNEDVQRMLDALLSESVTVKGSWWNIFPGGQPFRDETRSLLTFTVGDIPASERKLIEEALKGQGRPVSDAMVLDLYLETRARQKGGR